MSNIDNNFNELEECSICYETFINKFTSCKTCKKCICLNCYNKIKIKLINTIPIDETYERGIMFNNKCPFCTNISKINFNEFDKEEILLITSYDYTMFNADLTEYEICNNELEYENEKLKSLLVYKNNYNKSNKNKIINDIIEVYNNEITKLKNELKDKSNEYKADIYKYDNNRLMAENTLLKKELSFYRTNYNNFKEYITIFNNIIDNLKIFCIKGKSKFINKLILLDNIDKKNKLDLTINSF